MWISIGHPNFCCLQDRETRRRETNFQKCYSHGTKRRRCLSCTSSQIHPISWCVKYQYPQRRGRRRSTHNKRKKKKPFTLEYLEKSDTAPKNSQYYQWISSGSSKVDQPTNLTGKIGRILLDRLPSMFCSRTLFVVFSITLWLLEGRY